MTERKLYIVFGIAPVAFCDNLETAREFSKRHEGKHLEIREIKLNTEYTGLHSVPGESSENDWMEMWSTYMSGGGE